MTKKVRNKDVLAYPVKEYPDEWNPHLIHSLQLSRAQKYLHARAGFNPAPRQALLHQARSLEESLTLAAKQWQSAQEILNKGRRKGLYPLAYRLEPELSEPLPEDPIERSKFGGLPDFRYLYQFMYPEKQSLANLIATTWPQCGGCQEPMKYLGGVELSDCLVPLHLLTAKPAATGKSPVADKINIHHHQYGGLGFGTTVGTELWPLSKTFWHLFYCPESHLDKPDFDARLIIDRRLQNDDEKVIKLTPYRDAVHEFIAEHKLESPHPVQTVQGYNLRFDVDIPGEEFRPDWINKITEKHPEVFGNESPYQFFGRPRSQQTEKRYFCQNSALGPHRMAPIVNWDDSKRDFTYQIYGCLRCVGEVKEVYGKIDGSCT